MFTKIKMLLDSTHQVKRLSKRIESLEDDLNVLRSRLDLDSELLECFFLDRSSSEYQGAYSRQNPLVTICIATYNRGRLLLERSVKSALGQTYKNLEVLVVGDCCVDDTEALLGAITDPRLRFVNLPRRGSYPEDPMLRWMVAGTAPVNYALEKARGEFITHLDDDDEFPPQRIEKLLSFIQETRADIVWHPFWAEKQDGKWKLKECLDFKSGQVTTSSVFYHHWFARIPWDIDAYRYREPGDWNRFRKFKYLGAKAVRYPEPLLRHYKERNQVSR